jgi:hypothetical protein
VAVFWNPTNARLKLQLKETEAAARVLGVKIQSIEIVAPDDFDTASRLNWSV